MEEGGMERSVVREQSVAPDDELADPTEDELHDEVVLNFTESADRSDKRHLVEHDGSSSTPWEIAPREGAVVVLRADLVDEEVRLVKA